MAAGGMSASQLHTNLSSLCVWGTATAFWILTGACLLETVAAPVSLGTSQTPEITPQLLVGAVSALLFITIVVYVVASCTDCYKSEVSTECHPATASSGVKWGGAGGYTAAASSDVNNRVLGAGFTGEVVIPTEGQPLPYALIPSQVPEAQGFRGYGSAEPSAPQDYSGGGAMGGMGGQWGGAGGPQNLPGSHFSPMDLQEPQEPPPPYTSAAYQ